MNRYVYYCPFCTCEDVARNANAINEWLECPQCGLMFQLKAFGWNKETYNKWSRQFSAAPTTPGTEP